MTEIFNLLGELLQRPDLNVIETSRGKTTRINRDAVSEPLQRLLETEEMKGAELSEKSMGRLIDLFVEKRQSLEERCPSGLYATDVLWDAKNQKEMSLEEALKVAVEAHKKATQAGGGGQGKRKKRRRTA
jgi:hypothetical protein